MSRDHDIAHELASRSAAIESRLADFLDAEMLTSAEQCQDADDLLSLLLLNLRGESNPDAGDKLEALILRVNRPDHSIADLHGALVALKRSIVECLSTTTTPFADVTRSHELLDRLFQACLERTALVHELIIESSRRAYCEVDVAGHIVHANKAMHELLRLHKCRGLHLIDFFPDDEEHIESSFAGAKPLQVRRMQIKLEFGTIPVSAEFGPLRFRGCVRGGYAVMVDVSNFVNAEHKAFETSRFGILRVAQDGRITYANPQAADILGQSQAALTKTRFRDFFPDPKSQTKLDEETENRKRGRGSRYNLELPRNGHKPIPLQVDATPEFDVSGTFVASFVVLQSLHVEHAVKAIHKICESGKRGEKIVNDVLSIVRDFVPFDFATFAVYTPDAKFTRVVSFFPPPEPKWETLWFPVTSNLQGWLLGPSPWAADLETFVRRTPGTENVAESPTLRRLVNEGYHAFICCALTERDRLAAILSLFSRQDNFYNEQHHSLLKNDLGVESALRVALYALKRKEQEFLLRLAQMVDSTTSLKEVAENLVRELSRFYGWQNVSIFKVNRVRARVELLAQSAGKVDGYLLPAHYQQPLNKGVLGFVAKSRQFANLSDVGGHGFLSKIYVPSNSATRSELCLPIRHGGDVYWLLNLEDRRLNAFAPPEVDKLNQVIQAVEAALMRLFDGLTFEEIFTMSFDGVVITDLEGTIFRCNPAAELILQEESEDLRNLSVINFIDDDSVKQRIVTDRIISQAKTIITGKRGGRTSVLINGGILPDEYNRKVLFVKDLTQIELQRDLRFASAAMNQLSSETRIPLALASSLMQTAGRLIRDPERFVSMTKQAIAQIGRVEMTYDRLIASVDRQRLPPPSRRHLDLSVVIRRALEQLGSPAEQPSNVDVDLPPDSLLVEGDPYQLSFVIKSILTFILRVASPAEHIKLTLRPYEEAVALSVVGPACRPRGKQPNDPISDAEEEARGSVILAEPVLREIIETNHHGTFNRSSPTPDTECFELRLPRVPATSNGPRSNSRQ